MIKHQQAVFGERGNCFATCIASILELPLDVVPNFCDADDWFGATNLWLRERRLFYFELAIPRGSTAIELCAEFGYHLIHGPAARGFLHTCVGYGGKIVHDPHPSNVGLLRQDEIGLLIPLDPSLSQRSRKTRPLTKRKVPSEKKVLLEG